MPIIVAILFLLQGTCYASGWIFNNPYPPSEYQQKIYYTSFTEQPKTLDPARAYSSNELQFIGHIYEPVLQYDYLSRPYQLVPLTASQMPEIHYYDRLGQEVFDATSDSIVKSVYTIRIKPGILYQPHPAFARDEQGHYRYDQLPPDYVATHHIFKLSDFKFTGTRELVADDYIYQIKRLANPRTNSPIYGLMSDSVNFILENISAKVLSATQLNESKEFYEEKFHQKNNCSYSIQYGNDTSTLLPSHSVDKVIIENTFHEFSKPLQMLNEIHRILKPNGKAYLYEIIGTTKYSIHKHCRKHLYSKEELNSICNNVNFKIVRIEKGEDEVCGGCCSLVELGKK